MIWAVACVLGYLVASFLKLVMRFLDPEPVSSKQPKRPLSAQFTAVHQRQGSHSQKTLLFRSKKDSASQRAGPGTSETAKLGKPPAKR